MQSFALVIFGITGNLSQIKLLPALYDLEHAKLLPENMQIIGVGRLIMSPEEFKQFILRTLALPNRHHTHTINIDTVNTLVKRFRYVAGDFTDEAVYTQLNRIFTKTPSCKNRMYYLATYPDLYATIFEHMQRHSLNDSSCGWIRIMIEKPIGSDEKSAKDLNALMARYYRQEQIFRLDHYLGKETIQNILAFRFANGIFEPLMNADYIDHIQVTAAEDFGIGQRGGYYDSVGALKDVGQNHLLQMIAIATMDAPGHFSNDDVTKSRVQAIRRLTADPSQVIFGQYEGYQKEKGVSVNSNTDTFVAFKTYASKGPFAQIPIYVRAGKMLSQTVTEISIVFNVGTKRLFTKTPKGLDPNVLIYRVQPNEGIVMRMLTKNPGREFSLDHSYMQFCYHTITPDLPDPYLRLFTDALHGDQTFFVGAEESEAEWAFSDPLSGNRTTPFMYKAGSWGPIEADQLMAKDNRSWLVPSPVFCAR